MRFISTAYLVGSKLGKSVRLIIVIGNFRNMVGRWMLRSYQAITGRVSGKGITILDVGMNAGIFYRTTFGHDEL